MQCNKSKGLTTSGRICPNRNSLSYSGEPAIEPRYYFTSIAQQNSIMGEASKSLAIPNLIKITGGMSSTMPT